MTEPYRGNNPLEPILADMKKKQHETSSTAGGILSRLWRLVMSDLKISPMKFNELITSYLRVIHPGDNHVSANNARGSYNKKLAGKELSWKTFLEGLRIMGAYKVEISLKLTKIDGHESIHSLVTMLSSEEDVAKFREEWAKYHGIHPLNKEYIEILKSGQDRDTTIHYFDEEVYKLENEDAEGDTD